MSLNKTSIDDIFICAYILIKTAAMLLFLLIYLSIAATMEYNAVECCYISAEKSEKPKALPVICQFGGRKYTKRKQISFVVS